MKEKQLKEYRSKNHHLQNFKSVFDHRVNLLKEERGPLLEHLKSIDVLFLLQNHVRAMYKELLDEAAANKRLEQSIGETNNNIVELKEKIKKKDFQASTLKRKIENFQYNIMKVVKEVAFEQWRDVLGQVF